MKDLNEKINEIMNGKGSIVLKKRCLVELGLRNSDIDNLCYIYLKNKRENKAFVYTFGVEIECFIPRENVINNMMSNNVPFEYEHYNHTDSTSHFKFVPDSSVQGLPDPIECVSPVLKSRGGFKLLKACLKGLNKGGAKVNKNCGLHVHFGAKSMTEQQRVNIFKNYMFLAPAIESFLAKSRRRGGECNNWCRRLDEHYNSVINSSSIEEMRRALNCDRYHAVNAEAWARHHTIEFRQHQGTTDFSKIEAWVKFLAKLCEWSRNNELHDFICEIDEIPFLDNEEKVYFKNRRDNLNSVSA